MITLWARATESRRPDAITRDRKAVEICDRLDYDFSRFTGGWKSQVGVAVRDRHIDVIVRAFLARAGPAAIVNLGAGLDTRFFRIDDGSALWFDVDLPDAIALRRQFIDETDRLTLISCSALDDRWIERVREEAGNRPTLLLAEGVLMFFAKVEVRAVLDRFARAFPDGEMLVDLIGPLMVRFPRLHDTLPGTAARFRWGARSMTEVGAWSDRFSLASARSMLDECPARWRWMRLCRFIPALRRQFFVVHLRCSESTAVEKQTAHRAMQPSPDPDPFFTEKAYHRDKCV